jgi:hypothetical protein
LVRLTTGYELNQATPDTYEEAKILADLKEKASQPRTMAELSFSLEEISRLQKAQDELKAATVRAATVKAAHGSPDPNTA